MNSPTLSRSLRARYGLAWLPIPLALAAIAGLWVADVRAVWPAPVLSWLLSGGSAFLGVLLIAIPAARSFLAGGQASVLMLGCGVLVCYIGVAALPSGNARSAGTGFAIYNTAILLSALCQFAGVAAASRRKAGLRRRVAWLTGTYAGGAFATALVVWLALSGRMPVFFVEGRGGTLLRTLVVSAAVALFALTAGLLWRANRHAPSAFLYWYALGLILAAIGLTGSIGITRTDSPLQWAGRFTQALALAYTCVAVLASARETGVKGISLAGVQEAWLKSTPPAGWALRYGLAAVVVAAAFALNRLVTAEFGPGLPPFIVFYPAIMVAALLGGLGPGLAATILSGLVVDYWILPPVGELAVSSPIDRLGLVIFSSMGVFISAVSELYRRSRNKAAAYDREQALRESRREVERLAQFPEENPNPVLRIGRDGALLYANSPAREWLAAMGQTADGSESLPAAIGELAAGALRKEHGVEAELEDGRGRIFWFGATQPPGENYVNLYGRDITKRRRAEEELRRNREWLRVTLTSIGDGVIACDGQGRITFINPVAASLAGWSGEEALGQPIQRVFHIVNEVTGQPAEDLVARVLSERRTAGLANRTALIAKDGRRIPIEDSAAPILDSAGELAGVVLVFHDVTQKRRAQEALRESEEQYHSLFRNMAEGFALHEVVLDADGAPCDYRFLDVNPGFERLTGLAVSGLIGRTLREVLPGLEPSWSERYASVALTGEPATFESYAAPLGRWYNVMAYRPSPGRFAVVFVDITDRKAAEEGLREAQKLESIGLLAGGLAHDFNNLLVGVIGNASLAQDMVARDSPVAERLDGIVKTGEQLAHLTRQMLAYSGKGRFFLEALSLSDLIPEMLALVQPSIPRKIELRLELERGLPPIKADRGQIQQVFMNLVLNAAEAIGMDAGAITVKTALRRVDDRPPANLAPGEYVSLEVRDTGCGMDEATRGRIFDPFFSTKFVGRGLGLAAVGGIVRGHKGAITVTSAPGKGSSFTVLFPVTETAIVVAPATTRGTDLSGCGTILVVDDESVVREMARKALERQGYRVLLANRGPEAIDVVKRHPGDITLVFLDLSMPGMGGEEVLPELRKIRPHAKVIVSSGYSETETMRRFAGQEVSGFLHKPFTSTALAEKVKRALR
jgi:PAS domain S-box-containing protein